MGKAGRKPKHGVQRTTSGRISRSMEARGEIMEAEKRENQSVVKMRRLREKMEHEVTHPLFGFPLGKLALLQVITPEELDAGRAWAELTFRHAQIVGIMLPKCKAIDWGAQGGRSLGREPDEEQIERVKARKDDADNRIRQAGLNAMSEMVRVCVCDEEPSSTFLLKRALQKLVDK